MATGSESTAKSAKSRARFEKGKEKAIAACSGALVTSLLMNPFDVLKTRLQTQQTSGESLFVPSQHLQPPTASIFRTDASTSGKTLEQFAKSTSSSSRAMTNQATCCQPTYFTTNRNSSSLLCRFDPRITVSQLPSKGSIRAAPFSTAAAEVSAAACAFPNPHTAAQVLPDLTAPTHRQFRGPIDVLVHIIRHEGIGTLWRGVVPAMAISVPSQASYMVGYDVLRRSLLDRPLPIFIKSDGDTSEIHKLGVPLLAGAAVRASIVTFFSPIELLRTRLQSLPPSTPFTEVWRSTLQAVGRQGIRSLWQGLPATLWRDVPFSGIYWASYEIIQRCLTGTGFGEGGASNGAGNSHTFAAAFISGALGGSIAATITNPFDVIKTRRQVFAMASSQTTIAIMRDLYTREGLMRGLMRGLSPRLAKVAPACGLMISFYEIGLRWTAAEVEKLEMPE